MRERQQQGTTNRLIVNTDMDQKGNALHSSGQRLFCIGPAPGNPSSLFNGSFLPAIAPQLSKWHAALPPSGPNTRMQDFEDAGLHRAFFSVSFLYTL